jgi:hypothetical protein
VSSKLTIYETFMKSDIEALLAVGAQLALGFDASHARSQKSVHLEIALQISAAQIVELQTRSHSTYIKLKGGLMHGEGVYKLVAHHFEQDIVDESPKSFVIKQNRAIVRQGGVGDFVTDIGWWT